MLRYELVYSHFDPVIRQGLRPHHSIWSAVLVKLAPWYYSDFIGIGWFNYYYATLSPIESAPVGREMVGKKFNDTLFFVRPHLPFALVHPYCGLRSIALADCEKWRSHFSWEFDPGSGWTLAVCLKHASRTVLSVGRGKFSYQFSVFSFLFQVNRFSVYRS